MSDEDIKVLEATRNLAVDTAAIVMVLAAGLRASMSPAQRDLVDAAVERSIVTCSFLAGRDLLAETS